LLEPCLQPWKKGKKEETMVLKTVSGNERQLLRDKEKGKNSIVYCLIGFLGCSQERK
jgi:hypothetical protein